MSDDPSALKLGSCRDFFVGTPTKADFAHICDIVPEFAKHRDGGGRHGFVSQELHAASGAVRSGLPANQFRERRSEASPSRLNTDYFDLCRTRAWDPLTRPDEVAAAFGMGKGVFTARHSSGF